MGSTRPPIPSGFFYDTAARQEELAKEFRDRADKASMQENGHECGHQFTIRVSIVGHSGISGEGPESHTDANYADDMLPVTVRAHSLSEALHRAAMLPLSNFFSEEGPPHCENHKEVQHRDRKPPWCNSCGWSLGKPATPPFKGKDV